MRKSTTLIFAGLLAAAPLALAQSAPATQAPNAMQAVPQGDTGARPGNDIGTRSSLPRSPVASNINGMDTRSTIAPTPPAPNVPPGSPAGAFLVSANDALANHQSGTADEALERAETAILQRAVIASQADNPSADPVVAQIEQARQQIGDHDNQAASMTIRAILASNAPELSR